MADTPIEPPKASDYPPSMETRLAIVETMAQQNLVNQQTLVSDMRSLRTEIGTLFTELRAEIGALRSELRSELHSVVGELRSELHSEVSELRRIHDRDFRLTFGAIITTALGLAALIAHVAHWL
jgi:capsule polysaccharide export protein KpsE/RkpR